MLLLHQHHCITPSTLAGSDGTRFQHFPQVVPNLLNQWWGNSCKSFLKGSVIHDFYHMFCGMGTAQFQWIQLEHVMVFGQEPASSVCQLRGPGIQATQVQFIKQFTMSLPNCQPRGMGIVGLISPLQQLLFPKGFGHRQYGYCPGHCGFLLKGL